VSDAASASDTIARIEFTETGNSGPCKRFGWSHEEEEHTWTIGRCAELVVPLPPGERYLRLDVSLVPFVHPPRLAEQRLRIEINGRALRELALDGQDIVSVDIDVGQLADPDALCLVFNQPDAASPRSLGLSADGRVLGFGFQWLRVRRVQQLGASPFEPRTLASGGSVARAGAQGSEPGSVIVLGDLQAREVQEIAARIPSFERSFAFTWMAPAETGTSAQAAALREAANLSAVWCQLVPGRPEPSLLDLVPEGVPTVTFPRLTMPVLWPFDGPDRRLVPEPAYPDGRYVFGDTVAAGLADAAGTDDELFAEYLRRSAEQCPNVDAALEEYAEMLGEADRRCTIRVAELILDQFHEVKLFHNYEDPTGVLLRHIATRAIIQSGLYREFGLATVLRELSELTQGYQGLFQNQVPINPIVAQRYGLRWYDPAARYRYTYNKWTVRDYTLQYIRWRPWCF